MTQDNLKILEVRNLSNRYEGELLLQDISFSLAQGEILCLLGPSGSGKTTLLRLLAGLETGDGGTILFRGQDIHPIPPHKRNFGMMFQEYALFPHKSVWNNVAFGLEMQQCSPGELTKQVDTMLNLVGLGGFEDRKIDELSGGERQRVALARSLAPEPQLLLLDEPLGSLDRTLRDRLTGEIRSILKSLRVTAVFVTHDQAEAFSVADKVAVLHNGILQQFTTAEKLYRAPKNRTVAQFLGFNNLIDGKVDRRGLFHTPFGQIQLADMTGQALQPATLLIRPEGAQLSREAPVSPGSPNLSGTVIDRRFQGSTFKLKMQIGQNSLSFDLPIDPPPPEIGQTVHLKLKQSALVLIVE